MWKKSSKQGRILLLFLITVSIAFIPFFVGSSLRDKYAAARWFGYQITSESGMFMRSVFGGILTSFVFLIFYLILLWPFSYSQSSIIAKLRVVLAALISLGLFLIPFLVIVYPPTGASYLTVQIFFLVMGVGLLILPYILAKLKS
jgi:hypothetical protein